MASIKIKGDTSGSTTITAPATGSDETIELSTVLDAKAPLASPTFTGTPALPDGTTLAGSLLTSGKILQIVRATDSTNRTTTSTSLVDAGISVTITPTKSTSAILLIWTSYASPASGGSNSQAHQITDSSNNAISGAEGVDIGSNDSATTYAAVTLVGYATPATTSAVTYKGRWRMTGSGATARLQNGVHTGQMFALELGA